MKVKPGLMERLKDARLERLREICRKQRLIRDTQGEIAALRDEIEILDVQMNLEALHGLAEEMAETSKRVAASQVDTRKPHRLPATLRWKIVD
jgi:hypothetical protein